MLAYVDHLAGLRATQALITIPGLGCGAFAGRFHGRLGVELQRALEQLLEQHGKHWPHIGAIYFDPYRECQNERIEIERISMMIRPLLKANESGPQLCRPEQYEDEGDDFSNHYLFSIVAWDHVSWPGNDYYLGVRQTDDGVKAAATDAISIVTGLVGRYDRLACMYRPPNPYLIGLRR